MTTPRRVRRAPLVDRIQAYLNPWDFLLWLSEEVNSNEWQEAWAQWAIPGGVMLNIIFMIAKANAAGSPSPRADDVFGDYHERRGTGWLAWFSAFVVHLLTLFCFLNAFYTFFRRRHYRLFEQSVDIVPSTPSAKRVRVDSSPMSSSPLRYLSNMLHIPTAEERAHPDAVRDVWEVAVWDPTPLCLRLFCLFSPGHVLVYWLFLPLKPLDPRPSVTVVTTMTLAVLLSAQLFILQTFSSQQAKDAALIHKQVQHEYDSKFVHPSLNKPVRDAGTQMVPQKYASAIPAVTTSTPVTYVNRGFKTSPNPNYTPHLDMDKLSGRTGGLQRSVTTPSLTNSGTEVPTSDFSSPLRPTPTPAFRQPVSKPARPSTGDGGNLGIYSHAHSPLRKQASQNFVREKSPEKRPGSPLKRVSTPGDADGFHVRQRHLKGDGLRRQTGNY